MRHPASMCRRSGPAAGRARASSRCAPARSACRRLSFNRHRRTDTIPDCETAIRGGHDLQRRQQGVRDAGCAEQCDVVERDLAAKHEAIRESAFAFLRGTYFRWARPSSALPRTREGAKSARRRRPAHRKLRHLARRRRAPCLGHQRFRRGRAHALRVRSGPARRQRAARARHARRRARRSRAPCLPATGAASTSRARRCSTSTRRGCANSSARPTRSARSSGRRC